MDLDLPKASDCVHIYLLCKVNNVVYILFAHNKKNDLYQCIGGTRGDIDMSISDLELCKLYWKDKTKHYEKF